jgi:hypothetical protein
LFLLRQKSFFWLVVAFDEAARLVAMVLGGDGYGTRQDCEEAAGSRRGPVGRLPRTRAIVAVVAAAACLSALVVLAGQVYVARD